jgi:DinB superfamily
LIVYSNITSSQIDALTSKVHIGVVDRMTRDERRKMLESFGRAPALLSALLRGLPKKMWLYKPSPERWSIHEIILHLADSEASSYVRCRHLIAEPGLAVAEFDPALWAGNLGYFHQSTREALEIIRRLRKMTYQLLVSVPESVWSHTVEYPKEGAISLESWIERQERHVPHHMEQMRKNYGAWIGTHPPRKPATHSPGSTGRPRTVSLSSEYC